MSYQTLESIERRRRIIRIILFVIILGTMPFYCVGFLLWGTAKPVVINNSTILATGTPIGNDLTATTQPTSTPFSLTITVVAPLQPTPLQFIPINRPPGTGAGGGGGAQTFVPQPTLFIPTSTLAPTLTPFPTQAPPATQTPLPTEPPLPTNTPEPPPTDTPPPTETPLPTEAPTADVPTVDPGTGGTTP